MEYSFIVFSPKNKVYAIQTIYDWSGKKSKGRFSVYNTTSGKMLWQTDKLYGRRSEVFLSDDGRHVIVIVQKFTNYGYKDASRLPVKDIEKKLNDTPVIFFYRQSELLNSHTLGELMYDLRKLSSSSSLSSFSFTSNRYEVRWRWDLPPNADRWKLATYVKDSQITVIRYDLKASTFNVTNGECKETINLTDVHPLYKRYFEEKERGQQKDPFE